jgi:hypothetical protein
MKVPVSALRAGFIFSKPVYIDKDNFLVPAGVAARMEAVLEPIKFAKAVKARAVPAADGTRREKNLFITQALNPREFAKRA